MRPAIRWSLHLAAPVAGALVGLLGSFVHAVKAGPFPVGAVLALVMTALVFYLAGTLTRSRLAVVAAVLGWCASTLLLASPRAEGDLVVAGDGVGYLWLVGGLLVGCAAMVAPYAGPTATPPGRR